MFHGKHLFSRIKQPTLLTADIISREIAFLGSKITKTEGFHIPSLQIPKVQIKTGGFDSDLHEITVQKDNLRTSMEVPLFALLMSLDDFSEMYLQPVVDKLYTDHSAAQIRP